MKHLKFHNINFTASKNKYQGQLELMTSILQNLFL